VQGLLTGVRKLYLIIGSCTEAVTRILILLGGTFTLERTLQKRNLIPELFCLNEEQTRLID